MRARRVEMTGAAGQDAPLYSPTHARAENQTIVYLGQKHKSGLHENFDSTPDSVTIDAREPAILCDLASMHLVAVLWLSYCACLLSCLSA